MEEANRMRGGDMANRDYENRRFMGEDRERWQGRGDDVGFRGGDYGRRLDERPWLGDQGYSYGGREDYGRREDFRRFGREEERDFGGRYGEDWRGRGPGFYGSPMVGRFGLRGDDSGRGYDYGRGYARGPDEGFGGREDERGPLERLGDKVREGFRRMTGRPPKAYTRSDDRIREDIYDRLMMGWVDAENVEVQVKSGEVTLTGTVESRSDKRLIEDIADDVLGVKDIHNQLKVGRREDLPPSSTSGQRIARS